MSEVHLTQNFYSFLHSLKGLQHWSSRVSVNLKVMRVLVYDVRLCCSNTVVVEVIAVCTVQFELDIIKWLSNLA